MDDIEERLRLLDIEDFIWIIYIGIIILSFYSNNLERDYFINNNIKSKQQYRAILFIIFLILVIVYSYIVNKNISSLSTNDNKYQYMALIASILILISGIIYLYIIIKDEDVNVEIAFN